MRKVMILAMMAAAVMTATAAKKNKKAAQPAKPQVVLTSAGDSLSYLAGYAQTEGLMGYLQQELKVDTAYMADFVKGLNDAMEKDSDPAFNAYSAGMQIAHMLTSRMVPSFSKMFSEAGDSLATDKYYAGFAASLAGDTTVTTQKHANSVLDAELKRMQEKRQREAAEKFAKENAPNREAGKAFLAENAKKEGVKTTASGLQYKVLTQGNGPVAKATDKVSVKYEGKLIDGTVFDSSYERPEQITSFAANQVIKGWTEALTMMPAGSKWQLFIPYELAYENRAMGKIKPYSALIFTVEVVDIERDGKSIVKGEAAKSAPVKGGKAVKSAKKLKK